MFKVLRQIMEENVLLTAIYSTVALQFGHCHHERSFPERALKIPRKGATHM